MAQQLNNSVARAFDILRLLGRGRSSISVAEVTREMGMNAITAHRFLKTLEAQGALVQTNRGSYRLGYGLVDLGERARSADRLGQWLQPVLDQLTADVGEASMATLYQAGMVVCIARAMSPRSLSVDIRVGDRLEAYCTAHGKLWLAHVTPAERARYLRGTRLDALTGQTITHRAQLQDEIDAVGRRGVSYNMGEREDGITAIAMPVMTQSGSMVAGLSVFGPSTRLDLAVIRRIEPQLALAVNHAQRILYGRAGQMFGPALR